MLFSKNLIIGWWGKRKIFHYLSIRALRAYSLLFNQMLPSPLFLYLYGKLPAVCPQSPPGLSYVPGAVADRKALEYCGQK